MAFAESLAIDQAKEQKRAKETLRDNYYVIKCNVMNHPWRRGNYNITVCIPSKLLAYLFLIIIAASRAKA